MPKRIIITTGGTGGHIFPALATTEALKELEPGVEILFIGGRYGMEDELAKSAGLDFVGLPVRGIIGRGFKAVGATLAMGKAIWQARNIIKKYRADAVMGFGGYAAFAAMYAARTLHIPCGLHEQNAIPGAANRLAGKFAQIICLSMPDISGAFPAERTVLTGNPIRANIAALTTAQKNKPESDQPSLLIMGGSQGAMAINTLIVNILPSLHAKGVNILHQTGKGDLERVRQAYLDCGYSQESAQRMVLPFIHDMARALAEADLVLCRAGAATLAELAVAGKASILVPFPHAAHDHQTANAMAFKLAGAARLIPENDLPATDMAKLILELLLQPEILKDMEQYSAALAKPDASKAVAGQILKLAQCPKN